MKIESLAKVQKVPEVAPDLFDACYVISIYDHEINCQAKFKGRLVKSLLEFGPFVIDKETGYAVGTITVDGFNVEVTLT